MYCLVVVDMQPAFVAAKCDVTTKRIIALIRKAKRDRADIVILEYGGYGETRLDIVSEVANYPHVKFATKHTDDGSSEVLLNTSFQKFFVCGVNFTACVYETCMGLAKAGKVFTYRDACNQPSYWDGFRKHKAYWNSIGVELL